jgi:hypothetical protein
LLDWSGGSANVAADSIDCEDICIQEPLDRSRVSFKKIAINMTADDLLPRATPHPL